MKSEMSPTKFPGVNFLAGEVSLYFSIDPVKRCCLNFYSKVSKGGVPKYHRPKCHSRVDEASMRL